jgi:hypothetical protein
VLLAIIVGMYIARVPNRKSRPAILLRESYREGGKVCTRTIANLTNWAPERIVAMERLVKGEFDDWSGEMTSGEIFGVLFALKQLADQVGLTRVLGSAAESKLNLFLILARIAHGGSRLSAVRWAKQHTVADVLGVEGFDEDDLYAALDWLASQQERIERELYQAYVKEQGQPPVLVLYDVTSSYFEGECNELGQYGYNRDGKRGKANRHRFADRRGRRAPRCARLRRQHRGPDDGGQPDHDPEGAVRDCRGGDGRRSGMIKAKGKAALSAQGFRYITALTDAQIRTFLKEGVLQTDLFDAPLCEVEHDDKRLIVRRNETVRVREGRRREDKWRSCKRRSPNVTPSSRTPGAPARRQAWPPCSAGPRATSSARLSP